MNLSEQQAVCAHFNLSAPIACQALGGTRNLRIAAGAAAVWTSGEFQLDGGHLDNFGLFEIRGDQDLVGGVVVEPPEAPHVVGDRPAQLRAAGTGWVLIRGGADR